MITATPLSRHLPAAEGRSRSWQQAYAESITDPAELLRRLNLGTEWLAAAEAAAARFALRVPESFLARIEPGNIDDPLLRQVLPLGAELDEFLPTLAGANMDVVLFLSGDRGFPFNIAAVRAVVVAHEKAGRVGQGQNLLDRIVKGAGIAAREVGAGRAAIGHEERVANEGGVAHDVGHAGRGVAGCVDRADLHGADLVFVAILEQAVELAAVALEFGAFVEDLAEYVLNDLDVLANADLAAELFLNIGRGREVVGMDVGFDDPLKLEAAILDEGDDLVGVLIGDAAGEIVDVHDRVDHGARFGVGIFHDITDGVGRRVEEGGDVRLDAEVGGLLSWFSPVLNGASGGAFTG